MKTILALCALTLVCASMALAATAEEQTLVASFRKAFESSDRAGLESFLYIENPDPQALEVFKKQITAQMGTKLDKVEVRELSAADKKTISDLPAVSGGKDRMPVVPTKKLYFDIAIDSNTSTAREPYIALVNGKYVIPVPALAK